MSTFSALHRSLTLEKTQLWSKYNIFFLSGTRTSKKPRSRFLKPNHFVYYSIIAVTGLAGHAFGSWKSKGRPEMWLRDFLPESIPNARILTYGYDTKLPGSQSEASILELSRRLLESIKTTRDPTKVRN